MPSTWSNALFRPRREVTNCDHCCFDKPHVYFKDNEASCWLALRARVLRRAVSQSARPAKHRAIVRSLRAAQTRCASWQDLRTWLGKLINSTVPLLKCSAPKGQAVTPNHSLNRTLHSVPAFALAKTLAQIPPHCSGPVSSNVRRHRHRRPRTQR